MDVIVMKPAIAKMIGIAQFMVTVSENSVRRDGS